MKKCPDRERKYRKENERSCRYRYVSDLYPCDRCKCLIEISFKRDRCTKTFTRKSPYHVGAVIRKYEPHHAHERYGRKSDISRDHHLSAFDLIKKPSVKCSEHERKRCCDKYRNNKRHPSGKSHLNRDGSTEQSGNDPERQSEVESASAVYHRDHGKDEYAVP